MTTSPQESYSGGGGWAVGWIAFAGVIMIMTGVFQAVDGLVGILDDNFYATGQHYTYELSTTGWGWINLIIGVLVLLAGIGLFSGNTAARAVAVAMALISATANFLWLPYYPVWSIIVIALNVTIIWAVIAHGGELRARD